MPKYLVQASYTQEGVRGLLKEGGTSRRKAVEDLLKGAGGKLEGFYFSFGESDAIVIADLPDNASAAALALVATAAGAVQTKTTVLLTPQEVDEAVKKGTSLIYRAPGQPARGNATQRAPAKAPTRSRRR